MEFKPCLYLWIKNVEVHRNNIAAMAAVAGCMCCMQITTLSYTKEAP
jgi:hypothetical protein